MKFDSHSNVIAAFDFDGTLTTSDSLLPFLRYLVGDKYFCQGILQDIPILIGYALKIIDNSLAKEALISHFIQNKSCAEVQEISDNFAKQVIPKMLRPQAIQQLKWHQLQGHKTIVISASLEVYLLPWAKVVGFDLTIATQLQIQNGRFNGKFRGKNCYGQQKVERLRAMLGDLNDYCLYVYGDSDGDRPLLEKANYPYYRSFS